MAEEHLPGYRGALRQALIEAGMDVGDSIRVTSGGVDYEGSLMPRVETSDDHHIVVKMKSGYNIGLLYTGDTKIVRLGKAVKPEFRVSPIPEMRKGLPRVSIISTGGTIASRVDYITGGVHAAISASDLLSIVPELSDVAAVDAEILFSTFSENISPSDWSIMARKAADKIKEGVDGIVFTHGTDTLGYSSAALSFALKDLPIPVIFVGSQRSSDRPSSDAATNLLGVVQTAGKAPFAEVALGMHETTSDTSIIFHRGTKVRKFHTSTRYAFQSVNSQPLARFNEEEIQMISKDYHKRGEGTLEVRDSFEEKVALLKFHPGFTEGLINHCIDDGFKGIVIEGTGLGHTSTGLYEVIKRADKAGILLGMTSQCIYGRVDMDVYSTGRELQALGVQPLGDMLPETALVKQMWALANSEDIEEAQRIMMENIAGEYSDRTLYTGRFG